MATRLFELAKELGVTSKTMLEKCRAEGLEIRNHMATLSAGQEATIREWFTEGAAVTAVETSAHVDLQEARKEATKQRRRGKKDADETAALEDMAAVEPAEPETAETAPAEFEAVVEAITAPPEVTAAEPHVGQESQAAPVAQEAPLAPITAVIETAAAPPTAPQTPEVAPAPVEAPPAPPVAASAHPQTPAASAPAAEAPAQPQTPPPAAGTPKGPVKPAGPQLIPRPARLQGPRVVRVEKPDFIQPPRRRPPFAAQAAAPQPGVPTPAAKKGLKKPTAEEEEEERKAAAKKRSPRRRGGRSADAGEATPEWRDQDLAERAARLSAATGGLRRHRPVSRKGGDGAAAVRGKIEVDEPISVKSLSAATGVKTGDIIRKLMEAGTFATINQMVEREMAEAIMLEMGIEIEVKRAKSAEEDLVEDIQNRITGPMEMRAPVVTFLGHVDHGKTSLLDRIRSKTVASGEAGGITQHMGAYRFDRGNSHVVFLDTPGHEAFTAMRARGANMTDVVVLVVAADDGVMPQTIEALNHAKAAKVPIVVALNKIDMPNANETRVLGQLAEHGLQPREWGGNVEVIRTSAATGQGIDTLVETLSLEAELLELKAEPAARASGFVIEAKMDPGMGVLARLLVLNGTLKIGDIILAGRGHGRIRQIQDDLGRPTTLAGPATPVEVSGLDEVPQAGDRFNVLESLDQARSIVEDRRQRARSADLATVPQRTLESLLNRIEADKSTELALIIKADVQGSIEAITGSIAKMKTEEVRVNVLHAAVGGITTGDVSLAEASKALVIGFNVVADSSARQLAEEKGVDIRLYRIIYEILEDLRKAVEEGLTPEIKEQTAGRAEVRQVFKVSRVGTIAGCIVTDGLVNRSAKVRITRNNIVIADERTLESLKRFKDDAREVRSGMECGLKLAGYDDLKEGDILEFYQRVEVARKL